MTPDEQQGKHLKGWRFYALRDALKPRPKPVYVVDGLLRVPSLSIFFGAPETFKTMLLADMAACVAAGSPWLPAETDDDKGVERETKKSPVLVVDFDQGLYETHNRIAALARTRGLTKTDGYFHYVSMPEPRLDASKQEHTRGLAQRLVEEKLGIRLLVIDNLRLVSGHIDENNSEMSAVMNNLRILSDEIKAAVVVIHHQRKMSQQGTRLGDALRGHSSIEASLDLAVLVQGTKTPDLVVLTPTKRRYAQVEPFAARFRCKRRPDSHELQEAHFTGLRADSVGKTGQVRRAILLVVEEHPGIVTYKLAAQVKERLKIRASSEFIACRARDLEKEGKLVITEDNGYHHWMPGQQPH
jgi:hypothetical protein